MFLNKTEDLKKVEEAIREQQGKVKQFSTVWMAGEQLLDICRREPESARLVAEEMGSPGRGIREAEQKIRAAAMKNGGSCSGPQAEEALRKFYGLQAREEKEEEPEAAPEEETGEEAVPDSGIVDLSAWL